MIEASIAGSNHIVSHALLQVQQHSGAVHTAIDAFGGTLSADALQQPVRSGVTSTGSSSSTSTTSSSTSFNTTNTTSTTLMPCASTTTVTTTTTTSGQIHPANIMRSVGSHPLTEEERMLVGRSPLALNATSPNATTNTTTTTTTLLAGLSPWQLMNAYDAIGPSENCVMGEWTEWSACSSWEGDGLNQESRSRSREINRGPARGGAACGVTVQQEVCQSDQPETYERNMPSFEED